jgi:hypothetical protein
MMQTSAVRLSAELGYRIPGLGLTMIVAGLPPWPEPSSLSPSACPTSCEITVAMESAVPPRVVDDRCTSPTYAGPLLKLLFSSQDQ